MKKNAKFNNVVKVEGYVFGTGNGFNALSERVTGENSKNPGTKYISGDLEIAVDDAGLNVVVVHYNYITEFYKSGKPNTTYATLKRIIDSPDRTWIGGGKENAFMVSCESVSIGVNDFIAGDGTKVAAMRNENGFCSIVSNLNEEKDRTSFSEDILITNVTHIDADPEKNIEEDYDFIRGFVFGYGAELPKLVPATFVVRNKAGMQFFEDFEATSANPVFTKIWGKLNCMTIKIERKEESAFGEAAVQTFERKSKEYVITGTSKVPYDFGDEEVLTREDVAKMNQTRQIALAEIEKRHNDRKNAAEKTADSLFGEIPEGGFVF